MSVQALGALTCPRALPVGDAAVDRRARRLARRDHERARAGARPRPRRARPSRASGEAVPTHALAARPVRPGRGALRRPGARPPRARRPPGRPRRGPGGSTRSRPSTAGRTAPDLDALARARGLAADELARLHAATEYTAFMLGFTPGFAYLGLLPERLACARRATPRVRVPAGSVGLAGRQTGIYPVASPGGWQVIGRASGRLFDPVAGGARPARARRPRALRAGRGAAAGAAASRAPGDAGRGRRRGARTRLADDRPGRRARRAIVAWACPRRDPWTRPPTRRRTGPWATPLAPRPSSARWADPRSRSSRPCASPWRGPTSARCSSAPTSDRGRVPLGASVLARPGNVLRFAGRRSGCRAYVALRGGIDVPEVLGSRATDLASAFGGFAGRALRAGDRLALGRAPAGGATDRPGAGARTARATVRVVLGPQADHFDAATIARFLSSPWRVGSTSDRVGCRLEGEPLRHLGPAEILSDGMVPGSIQVPPDGRPIVMMADGPTTGGYPKIGTVVTADLPAPRPARPRRRHGLLRSGTGRRPVGCRPRLRPPRSAAAGRCGSPGRG